MIQLTIARRHQSGHISLKFPWPYLRHIWPNTVVPARDLPAITADQDLMDQFFLLFHIKPISLGAIKGTSSERPGTLKTVTCEH
jgi:hypothetical protein